MGYSFDDIVYFSSLIMFILALICIFIYEFFSLKSSKTVTKTSIYDSSDRKGKKSKKQPDRIV